MKLLFLSLCFISFVDVGAQSLFDSLTLDGSMVRFEKIIEHQATKDDLFTKAKVWFAETFTSAKEVIQLEDRAEGLIVGKGMTVARYNQYGIKKNQVVLRKDAFSSTANYVRFTIKMYFKESLVKVIVSDIMIVDDYDRYEKASYNKRTIDSANRLLTGKIRDQQAGRNLIELLKGINASINEMLSGIESSMRNPKEGF